MGELRTSAAELEEALAVRPELAIRKPTTVRKRSYEVDLWVRRGDVGRLASVLAPHGFRPFRAAKADAHRLFVQHTPAGWGKVDAKISDPTRESRLSDLLWLVRRRRGLVVAVLGGDGAGKTTLIRSLAESQPFATRVVYLGRRRRDASGRPVESVKPRAERLPSTGRRLLALVWWSVRTAFLLWRTALRARRGDVVLCDRHPLEAGSAASPEPEWLRLCKRLVVRALPAPDVVLLLDAPAQVLLSRKGEHDVEVLAEMNQALARTVGRRGGIRIDATRSAAEVLAEAERLIWENLAGLRQ